jgi:hypothetical protein
VTVRLNRCTVQHRVNNEQHLTRGQSLRPARPTVRRLLHMRPNINSRLCWMKPITSRGLHICSKHAASLFILSVITNYSNAAVQLLYLHHLQLKHGLPFCLGGCCAAPRDTHLLANPEMRLMCNRKQHSHTTFGKQHSFQKAQSADQYTRSQPQLLGDHTPAPTTLPCMQLVCDQTALPA